MGRARERGGLVSGAEVSSSASRQVMLLRGINVGGRNKIAMADLRGWCVEEGWSDVATYIQSGNVVLTAGTAPDETARRLSSAIATAAGFEVSVLGRSAAEMAAVARSTIEAFGGSDPSRVIVLFRDDDVGLEDLRSAVDAIDLGDDRWIAGDRHIVLDVTNGQSTSKLADVVMRSSIGRSGTARNLRTVERLVEMSQPA